mgnify:CR=1 FL=1
MSQKYPQIIPTTSSAQKESAQTERAQTESAHVCIYYTIQLKNEQKKNLSKRYQCITRKGRERYHDQKMQCT